MNDGHIFDPHKPEKCCFNARNETTFVQAQTKTYNL